MPWPTKIILWRYVVLGAKIPRRYGGRRSTGYPNVLHLTSKMCVYVCVCVPGHCSNPLRSADWSSKASLLCTDAVYNTTRIKICD